MLLGALCCGFSVRGSEPSFFPATWCDCRGLHDAIIDQHLGRWWPMLLCELAACWLLGSFSHSEDESNICRNYGALASDHSPPIKHGLVDSSTFFDDSPQLENLHVYTFTGDLLCITKVWTMLVGSSCTCLVFAREVSRNCCAP